MSCPEPDRVLDYLAHRLEPPERVALEGHVDTCRACRMLLVELARSDEPLGRPARDPDRVGRYRIEERLGEGGMGTVYAAYDPQLDRRVAIKLVHGELAALGGAERLVREGRALARLAHPNVVTVHDAGTDGDQVYIAMELVDGETLASWLAERPRRWRAIVERFVAAARGLAAAHAAGIVHRDVKPENVLLDRAGVPKVVDFGLADSRPGGESASPRSGDRITQPGRVVGTPAFMSPEQRRGDDVGPATDQYSLCAAIATALDEASPDRAHRAPRWLRRVLARGMASEPAGRYPSLAALVAALDPAARARRQLALTGAAVLVFGAAIATVVAWPRADVLAAECATAADARARLWTPADREAIARAMQATGLAVAEATIQRATAEIESYAAAIADTEAVLCERSAHQSELVALRAVGLECLANRRAGLASAIARLRHANADATRTAMALLHALDNVPECANLGAMKAELAARANPAVFAARLEARRMIDHARAAYDTGRYRDALVFARRAVERARSVGGAVLATALIGYGDLVILHEGYAAGEPAYLEAVEVTEATQADELRALAMANLMAARAREPGREREALAMRPLVEAAIERANVREPLLPVVLHAAGSAQLRLGQLEAAVASFKTALQRARAILPPGDPRLPDYIYPVGLALGYQRKDREALAFHDEAYRVAVAVWGTGHPNAERFAINLAVKRAALGDCDTALGELARAREAIVGVLPADSAERLLIAELTGTCHMFQGRHADAIREHETRRQALIAAGRAHSVEMASAWLDLGDTHLDRDALEPAITAYRQAIALLEPLVGTTDSRLGLPLAHLGDAELRAGRTARAIELLERALVVFGPDAPAATLADARFPLARALWATPATRVRARELAIAARDGYAESGPIAARQLAEVEAWLARR
jgi:eukaryotic-like serine/threonine-protein kinase